MGGRGRLLVHWSEDRRVLPRADVTARGRSCPARTPDNCHVRHLVVGEFAIDGDGRPARELGHPQKVHRQRGTIRHSQQRDGWWRIVPRSGQGLVRRLHGGPQSLRRHRSAALLRPTSPERLLVFPRKVHEHQRGVPERHGTLHQPRGKTFYVQVFVPWRQFVLQRGRLLSQRRFVETPLLGFQLQDAPLCQAGLRSGKPLHLPPLRWL
mmetsp:Transcript_128997/g.359167  ORF Transcript_128997/g.359167 Transcript_128997/m.359167 type:complete len:209 (+) Transcript_128997:1069-1695(+)